MSTTTSDRVEAIQESQEKNSSPQPGQVFISPVIAWHQELLFVMDEVNYHNKNIFAVFDCGVRNKIVRTVRKKLQVPLGCRLIEMACVFNSVESGMILFTDRNMILDYSSKQMQPISSLGLDTIVNPNDASFIKDPLDTTNKGKGDSSFSGKPQILRKAASMNIQTSNIEASSFIDLLGKHQLVFLEGNKVSVVSNH